MMETIFALSSGGLPAGLGIIRISGAQAGPALNALCGAVPAARRAVVRTLRDGSGGVLDRAVVLWFPGPASATGEDVAELHCHGGRAVIAAVEQALAALPGLRRAEPGEFTRRAFANGRIDLAEAEGLGDLLAAETELQRQTALAMAGGAVSRQVEQWRAELLRLSAAVEAVLDFGDEDNVGQLSEQFAADLRDLLAQLRAWLTRPRAEILNQGFRVVLAGPPNAGKSTLFNELVENDAAITAPQAGTTRDVLMRAVALGGVPFQFFDTAGLRGDAGDAIEVAGIARARAAAAEADLILWLGSPAECPPDGWQIHAQIDRADRPAQPEARHHVSAVTGTGLAQLRADLIDTARRAMPRPGEAALNRRQHALLSESADGIDLAIGQSDPLLIAEGLRQARVAFDALLGRTATEDMLDALFGRFCIGK